MHVITIILKDKLPQSRLDNLIGDITAQCTECNEGYGYGNFTVYQDNTNLSLKSKELDEDIEELYNRIKDRLDKS